MQVFIDETFNWWRGENSRQTEEKCKSLIEELQKQYLDPIFQKLTGEEAHNLSFLDVIKAYDDLKDEYVRRAVGAKDIIAEVFLELFLVMDDNVIVIIIIIVDAISSISRSDLTLPLELSLS